MDTSLFTPGGAPSPSATSNAETLSGEARVIETAAVARLAGRHLKPRPSNPLLSDITATADTETGFITIVARASTARRAADVANAFAAAVVHLRGQQAIGLLTNTISAQLGQLHRGTRWGAQLSQQLQRLRALRAAQGVNAQVLETAAPSASPVSPRVVRVTGLGLLAGLLLGMGAVFVAEAADRRIRHPEDLEELTGLPLLAVIPRSALSGETPSMQEGDAFHMLRSALMFFNVDTPLSTILVSSPVKGDGKATVATRLSIAAAQAGRDVILVDADLRRPQAASRLHVSGAAVSPGHGLASVLTAQISLEDALVDVPIDEPSEDNSSRGANPGQVAHAPGWRDAS